MATQMMNTTMLQVENISQIDRDARVIHFTPAKKTGIRNEKSGVRWNDYRKGALLPTAR
jgi:hypothetical protein